MLFITKLLTPLNVNIILVFFLVVVSSCIETPLEFLFSSLSVVGVVVFVVGVVGRGRAGFLCFFGRGVVYRVEGGLLRILNVLTLGFCVVNNCLLVVVWVGILGCGLSKLSDDIIHILSKQRRCCSFSLMNKI